MRSHICRLLGLSVVLLLSISPLLAQEAATVTAVAQHPDQYDKKTINVTGTIADYRERVSARGNEYTTFRLQDRGASISVFAWKHPGLRNRQRVRVIGVFTRLKRVSKYEFHNEIEAQRIDALP